MTRLQLLVLFSLERRTAVSYNQNCGRAHEARESLPEDSLFQQLQNAA